MTNKQLYNLVFENYVQAKRELLREGYTKTHLEEVDFNEIFDQTKKKMLEEKVKKLQRENEMLKNQLSQRRGLKQESSYSAAGMGKQSTDILDNTFTSIGAFFGNPTDMLTKVTKKLGKNFNDYRILLQYVSKKVLNSLPKIAKAIQFIDKLRQSNIDENEFEIALKRGVMSISMDKEPEIGIFENFKRKSLSQNKRRRY
jgi:hypothetical protein